MTSSIASTDTLQSSPMWIVRISREAMNSYTLLRLMPRTAAASDHAEHAPLVVLQRDLDDRLFHLADAPAPRLGAGRCEA